jgi:hypothetical protein
MPTPFLIPFSGVPESFTVTVNGIEYGFYTRFNSVSNCWMLWISDTDGNPLLSSIMMVTGTDLLGPYPDLGFGFQLVVQSVGDVDNDQLPTEPLVDHTPAYGDLGVVGFVYAVLP